MRSCGSAVSLMTKALARGLLAFRAKGVCSAMTAETRRRVKAGLPGRERESALHKNHVRAREGGARGTLRFRLPVG